MIKVFNESDFESVDDIGGFSLDQVVEISNSKVQPMIEQYEKFILRANILAHAHPPNAISMNLSKALQDLNNYLATLKQGE